MKKLFFMSSMLLILISCETDSVENIETPNQVIVGYKYTREFNYDDPALDDYKNVTTGNLFNGKLFSETHESFVNGISQGSPTTVQYYFYTNNRLSLIKNSIMDRYYFYDNGGNLIGCSGVTPGALPTSGGIHELYIHQPDNVVFCERISLPYNDPAAVLSGRIILKRNSDGEVIAAGQDGDLDGTMDSQHTYTYIDGDMMSMQKPDGTTITFNYSTVLDTYSHLQELSFGKQVQQFPCAQTYSTGYVNGFEQLKYSKHVSSSDVLLQDYQTLSGGFYFKRTLTSIMPVPNQGTETEEVEYFFN